MNIAVLEGYVCNPGDLSWDGFERYGDVTVYERTPRETLRERMKGVEIVIATKVIWDKEALDWSPDLKLIALASTGYNVVDLDEARRRGIMVCNVPAYSTPDVAQMTIALMLELCLNVGKHTRQVLDGAWTRTHDFCFYAMPLIEVAGKTLGIVGMGSIGQAVAFSGGQRCFLGGQGVKLVPECMQISHVYNPFRSGSVIQYFFT